MQNTRQARQRLSSMSHTTKSIKGPERSAALPNSQLELIYYIEMSRPNSVEVRGHPFEGRLYNSIIMWCPQIWGSTSLFIA